MGALVSRAWILGALSRCSSMCLDNAEERERVADEIVRVLRDDPDARLIRTAFEGAKTGGTRIIAMRGYGGRIEANILDAAARLAGCES